VTVHHGFNDIQLSRTQTMIIKTKLSAGTLVKSGGGTRGCG